MEAMAFLEASVAVIIDGRPFLTLLPIAETTIAAQRVRYSSDTGPAQFSIVTRRLVGSHQQIRQGRFPAGD